MFPGLDLHYTGPAQLTMTTDVGSTVHYLHPIGILDPVDLHYLDRDLSVRRVHTVERTRFWNVGLDYTLFGVMPL